MTGPRCSRGLAALAVTGSLLLGGLAAAPAQAANPNSDAKPVATGVDKTSVFVEFTGEPLATASGVARTGKGRVDLGAAKTKNARAQLAHQRNAFRQWLKTNAPGARITGEYDLALNGVAVRLGGTSVETLKSAPGVKEVTFQETFTKAATDIDLARIDAPQGWAAAGATSVEGDPTTWAGYGMKVGVIDSGIDVTHPCFDDEGFAPVPQLGDKKYTNNKVIVARVFNNKLNQNGFDAKAIGAHGTHVAGTIACDLRTPANVEGADIPFDPSGVAPGARLGSYSVFPGDVENARSEDIANAMEAAYADGMDVINMSLGGGHRGVQSITSKMADNLDRAGVVMAIAAGNDGPGYSTVGNPGTAADALTAGASSVGQYIGLPILAGDAQLTVGAIGAFPAPDAALTGVLATTTGDGTLGDGCTAVSTDLTGKIALVSRGACSFGQKVATAEAAGAIAVIVVNNAPGDPISMATDEAYPTTIPAVMVPLADREALIAKVGSALTLAAERAYKATGNDDLLMDFSSWGPTRVNYLIKPDVVAPGGNILSSLPQADCDPLPAEGCWGLMSGTSMATPHLAGMAAVVKDAHPGWTATQIRSAIVNTADRLGVLKTDLSGEPETDVQKVGAGLADLDAAVSARLTLSRTSVSFGAVPAGSGKKTTQSFTVTNVSGATVALKPTIVGATMDVFSARADKSSLAPGETATVTVTLTGAKAKGSAPAQAHIYLEQDSEHGTHAALYVLFK